MKLYIAAAFPRARFVDEIVAPALTARGLRINSRWHRPPWKQAEALDVMPLAEVQAIAAQNDYDISTSDVVLVLAEHGRETYCEARIALSIGLPVVWEGPRILTAYREGVTRVVSLAAAYDVLAGMVGESNRRAVG